MIRASRVIIIHENKILLIHRIKEGKEYYVLPGGKIEYGETPEEAAIREVKEETSLTIEIEKLLWEHSEHFKDKFRDEKREGYYFLAKSFEGKLELGGPEKKLQSEDNRYVLEWFLISELKNILMYPKDIKKEIIKIFN